MGIVIPYYKGDFIDETLKSLCDQSCNDFILFVFDDASPIDIGDKLGNYDNLDIRFKRFEQNLGRSSLAAQWNRCLVEVDTDWVIFLPDDDTISENLVSSVRKHFSEAERLEADIMYIPNRIIDGFGNELRPKASFKNWDNRLCFYDTVISHAYGDSLINLGNIVYRTKELKASGGFHILSKGWGSDHVTALRVAGSGKKIIHVSDGFVNFRSSDVNISSQKDDMCIKIRARAKMHKWIVETLTYNSAQYERLLHKLYHRTEYNFIYLWANRPCIFLWYFMYSIRMLGSSGIVKFSKGARLKYLHGKK